MTLEAGEPARELGPLGPLGGQAPARPPPRARGPRPPARARRSRPQLRGPPGGRPRLPGLLLGLPPRRLGPGAAEGDAPAAAAPRRRYPGPAHCGPPPSPLCSSERFAGASGAGKERVRAKGTDVGTENRGDKRGAEGKREELGEALSRSKVMPSARHSTHSGQSGEGVRCGHVLRRGAIQNTENREKPENKLRSPNRKGKSRMEEIEPRTGRTSERETQ